MGEATAETRCSEWCLPHWEWQQGWRGGHHTHTKCEEKNEEDHTWESDCSGQCWQRWRQRLAWRGRRCLRRHAPSRCGLGGRRNQWQRGRSGHAADGRACSPRSSTCASLNVINNCQLIHRFELSAIIIKNRNNTCMITASFDLVCCACMLDCSAVC